MSKEEHKPNIKIVYSTDVKPRMSIGLPAFLSKDVSWISIAGLSRQTDVPVPWEIVICQEDDSIDEDLILRYQSDLSNSGCVRITLIKLAEWICLSQKWRVIASHLGSESEVFLLQGVDDHPHRSRLRSSWNGLLDEQCDWFHWEDMIFFDFNFNSWSIFRGSEKPRLPVPRLGWEKHPCCPNMATRTKYLSFLKDENVKRGVDGWMFYCIQEGLGRKPRILCGKSEEQALGFGTTGFNHLSLGRIKQSRSPKPPVFPYEHSFDGILMKDEIIKLKEMFLSSRLRTINMLLDELSSKESALESIKVVVRRYRRLIRLANLVRSGFHRVLRFAVRFVKCIGVRQVFRRLR